MPPIRLNRVNVGRNPPLEIQRKLERRKELKRKIRGLQEEYQQRLDEYENIDFEIQQHAASIVPIMPMASINTIPNEILSSIFLEVFADAEAEGWRTGVEADLSTLTSVCRHWREVAIDNVLLWNKIRVKMHDTPLRTYKELEHVELFLQRSKNALLDIEISFAWGDWCREYIRDEVHNLVQRYFPVSSDPQAETQMEGWIQERFESAPDEKKYPYILERILSKLVGPKGQNMARWKSLYVSLDQEQFARYWSLFKGPVSSLKNLHIELGYGGDAEAWSFPNGNIGSNSLTSVDSVDSLVLEFGIPLSAFQITPETITSLDVWETSQWDTFSLLPSFVNLRKLAYRTLYRHVRPPLSRVAELTSIRIRLPSLQTLEFRGFHFPLVFHALDAPKLATLSIFRVFGIYGILSNWANVPISVQDQFVLAWSRYRQRNG
jgi:hypothetical protein